MMIFKSLCIQKPLLKSQEFGTFYADRGLRSGTPRWGYPSHRYRGGPLPFTKPRAATPLRRPLTASHIQMIVTNDESFPWLATLIWHWPKQKNAEWYCGKLRCNSTDRTVLTRHVNTEKLSCLARRDKALWFSTLLTTAIRRYLLIIRKLAY